MGIKDREANRRSPLGSMVGSDVLLNFEKTKETEINSEKEIVSVPIDSLVPYHHHIFKPQSKEKILEIAESIQDRGIYNPLIVRPLMEGGMEIISGHTRLEAARIAGLSEVPCRILELSDDEAEDAMVITNLQRESLLCSEKAWSYKIRMESMKKQGKKSEDGQKVDTAKEIGELLGDSKRTVHRYIQLTKLIPEFMDMCDEKKMSPFSVAIHLSSLTVNEQNAIYGFIKVSNIDITPSQAEKLKKKHDELLELGKELDNETISDILVQEKKRRPKKFVLKSNIRAYFSDKTSDEEIEKAIIELLEERYGKRDV